MSDPTVPGDHRTILRSAEIIEFTIWERGPLWTPDVFPRLVDICEVGHGFDLIVPLVFECDLADSWAGKGGAAPVAVAA